MINAIAPAINVTFIGYIPTKTPLLILTFSGFKK